MASLYCSIVASVGMKPSAWRPVRRRAPSAQPLPQWAPSQIGTRGFLTEGAPIATSSNEWNRPWWVESVQTGKVQLQFPAWCYACFHVGRTLQTDHEKFLALVQRFAQKTEWDIDSIYEKLNSLDVVYLSRDQVNRAVRELHSSKREGFNTEAPEYRGHGIGTAMRRESIRWAKNHDYAVVVGTGVPNGIPEAAEHAGALPWTTYARLGFRNKRLQLVEDEHPPVRQAKERALKLGRPEEDICHRMMVFDLL